MIRIYSILTIFLFFFSFQAFPQAPNWLWANRIGSVYDWGHSVSTDATGNIYLTGVFAGTADFDPGPGIFNMTSAGSNDIYICKLDANGNFVWARRLGGSMNDGGVVIKADPSGSGAVYTTGWFSGTADFDPGAGVFNITSFGGDDIFVSKLDASGNFVWAKQFGGTSNADYVNSMAIDPAGSVFLAGAFVGTSDYDPGVGTYNLTSVGWTDIYICKLDASGNFVWANRIGGIGNDAILSIALDASSNIYTTGYFYDTVDFDPSASTNNLTYAGGTYTNVFVARYSSAGNFSWAKTMGGISGFGNGNAIAVDASANVYIAGVFTGTSDFDPGAGSFHLTAAGGEDIFISKLNSLGNFVWAKVMGGASNDRPNCIALDPNGSGNIFIAGQFQGTADLNPGGAIVNFTASGTNDIFFSKFDNAGNYTWAQVVGGTFDEYCKSMAFDAAGHLFVTGYFFSPTITFGSITLVNMTGGGSPADIFIAKLDSGACAQPAASITSGGATTFCSGGSATLNANTGVGLTYQWRLNGNNISGSTSSSYVATAPGSYTCVVYNSCGNTTSNSITVTVNTSPAAPYTPSGLGVVCRNTTGNLYSVPLVGGASSYTWSVPTGATIFSGQGTNSVSINFGSTAVSGNICVYASNTCGNSSTSCKAITVVTANPTTPTSITGTNLPCANSNAVPYSCTLMSNAASYNWTVPANATIASGQGTNSITVNFGALFTSGNVSVQSVNCYGVSSFRTLFVRGKPSTPGTITGQSVAVCAGTNSVAYSITAVAGATTYNWTAPVNATIAGGQGTTSVTVNYGASFVSGTLSVTAGNVCGNSAARTLSISSVSAQPGTITGQTLAVCAGTNGVAYSVAAVTGATTYNWTAPVNAIIASGQGTRSVTVNYGAAFVSGTLSVTSGNACGTSAVRTLSISSLTATPGTVTGQVNGVCAGTNGVPYSIAAITNATSYFWTAPLNATIASGQGTTAVTVNYSSTFTTGTLSVKSVNACGMSGPRNVTIKSVPSTPGTITGAASVCANQTGVPFSIAAITGATTYNWTVPAGATVASGQGTTSITVNFGTTAGSVKVRSGNACGYSVFKTKTVSIVCREAEINLSIKGITLFPNPFTDEFTIISENNLSAINIYDVSGRLLETHSTISSDQEIKCGLSLSNGIYFAEIIISGERKIVKLIKEN